MARKSRKKPARACPADLAARDRDAGHDAEVDDWADFFSAPDDESAAAVKGSSPRGPFTIVPVGLYDPTDAVVEWESLLTGGSPKELLRARRAAGAD